MCEHKPSAGNRRGFFVLLTVADMAVRVKKERDRVRVSLRHYICTDAGPWRITSPLARELAHRKVAAPQFANSIQRMVEVFVETVAGDIRHIQIWPPRHCLAYGP